ncbi:TetR/AcrR family transcriptional regulator [Pseudonocardia oroxyli]|uniref:Transcriptional regulator, TetR family n=1 Tax=Pseudonocardia oroxyli TaxID=366584 RepID=A0A1G7SV63_PSEOR|nr:TetR/AcrR family transcriptional regulator [Pseudonocardia oroxyli]SDG26935.1 transcriptional regulator, TetR family [Pseudonocardia oroxyli]
MPRPRTFTESARREQLIAVTVDLVAEHGRRGLSLQRIADAAGISKAAVLYYFPSKDAVVAAAYDTVISDLVAHVGAAVEAAPDAATAIEAYLDSLLTHLSQDARRARLLAEALGSHEPPAVDAGPSAPHRWEALSELISTAQREGTVRTDADPRLSAIMLCGLVDAVVAASWESPAVRLHDARPHVNAFARHALKPDTIHPGQDSVADAAVASVPTPSTPSGRRTSG